MFRSKDYDYFRSVLERPGMRRAAEGGGGGRRVLSISEALADKDNFYFEVKEGDNRLGFLAFRPIGADAPEDVEIHSCLFTVGSRTVLAVRSAIMQCAAVGFRNFWAIFPSINRGARRVTDAIGFDKLSRDSAPIQVRLLAI